MPKDIPAAVREVCLWLPEAEEFISHGAPNFRVRGKSFGCYAVNSHGDGRVALWLCAPEGAQSGLVDRDPENYFVPPYVGPRGWIGVNLDRGLDWQLIAEHVRQAYSMVAPPKLVRDLGPTPAIEPPTQGVDPAEFDPLSTPAGVRALDTLREVCLSLPEVSESRSFGAPVWQAGKRSFATLYQSQQRLRMSFWAGLEMQSVLTSDPRFSIPAYTGVKGWIALDVQDGCDIDEVMALAMHSYRHFANQRMLKALPG